MPLGEVYYFHLYSLSFICSMIVGIIGLLVLFTSFNRKKLMKLAIMLLVIAGLLFVASKAFLYQHNQIEQNTVYIDCPNC